MNDLERSTYVEPNFDIVLDEFCTPNMTPEEREKARKVTEEFYKNFTDDDWRDLGNNY